MKVCFRNGLSAVVTCAVATLFCWLSPARAEEPALAVFEQRIMPIFNSPKPSSCVQCHLASVDLKDYILPSHQQTFVALRDQGLIDLKNPEQSKILKLIAMGNEDPDRRAQLIQKRTREAELAAFAAWIEACVKDEGLLALPGREEDKDKDTRLGPTVPDPVIRHARKDRLLDSFERNVWSQRMRCFPCHTPNEIDRTNPRHEKPLARYNEYVEEFGQRMNIFRTTPAETMHALIASSNRRVGERLPLLNTESPAESLLVLKPTSKLPAKREDGSFERPSSALPVSHMGGLKMFVNDHSYKSFMTWIEDYAKTVRGEYQSAEDLPPDNWQATQIVLRIKDIPQEIPDLTPVQMFVFARDSEGDAWQESPLAFTQGLVTPRRLAGGSLFMFLPSGDQQGESAPALRPGNYLIKVYADKSGRLKKEPTAFLPPDDLLGQYALKARWRKGFPQAEVLSAKLLNMSNLTLDASSDAK